VQATACEEALVLVSTTPDLEVVATRSVASKEADGNTVTCGDLSQPNEVLGSNACTKTQNQVFPP
jgi:hypothetical protein